MTATLAVTGSTGRVGGMVAQLLAEAGHPQRLVVRDRDRAPDLPDADTVVASYDDRPAAEAALAGIETLFMVSGAEHPDRVGQHRIFVDAAAAAGVRHIVYLSFYAAAPDATFTLARDHWATEQYIKASGMEWTFVRDNLYLDYLTFFAGDDGVLRGPAGEGRCAPVAQADIAAVVATIVPRASEYSGTTLSLTGPESLSMTEAAAALTRVLGRPIRYVDETIEEAYASRAGYGAPDWQVDAWVSTYTAIASGELAPVTDDVERVIGRRPIGLTELFG